MTGYDPNHHHRRSIRLKGYDYARPGVYFVTINTHDRECLFGTVVDGEMVLSPCGSVVAAYWGAIPRHFPHAELDAWMVMPNHVHGIVRVVADGPGSRRRGGDAWADAVPAAGPAPRRGEAFSPALGPPHGAAAGEPVPSPRQAVENASPLRNPPWRGGLVVANATPPLDPGDAGRPRGAAARSLGAIVGNFEAVTARRINRMRHTPGAPVWQRNYYEHVVRDEEDLARIRAYIAVNPLHWNQDEENPATRSGRPPR